MILTKDYVTFNKELVAVQVEQLINLSNVVRQVNWRVNCVWVNPNTQETWRWKLYINTDISTPNPESFISYEDLTSETIMSWLNLTTEQETSYENTCLEQFNQHVSAALANNEIPQVPHNWQGRQWI